MEWKKNIQMGAREVIALQTLLNVNVTNRRALLHERFLCNHQIHSSVNYTRAKRHSNFSIMYQDNGIAYGTVLGLLTIKPECQCCETTEQYCHCRELSIVLVQPMTVNSSRLCEDVEVGVASHFLLQVLDMDRVKAIMQHQILKKCISINLGSRTYLCPLPYRNYGD